MVWKITVSFLKMLKRTALMVKEIFGHSLLG